MGWRQLAGTDQLPENTALLLWRRWLKRSPALRENLLQSHKWVRWAGRAARARKTPREAPRGSKGTLHLPAVASPVGYHQAPWHCRSWNKNTPESSDVSEGAVLCVGGSREHGNGLLQPPAAPALTKAPPVTKSSPKVCVNGHGKGRAPPPLGAEGCHCSDTR